MKNAIKVLLDDEGRISIPPPLQSQLGLSPGMSLVVEEGENGELWLRLQSDLPTLVDKQGVLVVRAKPVGDLVNAVRSERDRRANELLQKDLS